MCSRGKSTADSAPIPPPLPSSCPSSGSCTPSSLCKAPTRRSSIYSATPHRTGPSTWRLRHPSSRAHTALHTDVGTLQARRTPLTDPARALTCAPGVAGCRARRESDRCWKERGAIPNAKPGDRVACPVWLTSAPCTASVARQPVPPVVVGGQARGCGCQGRPRSRGS